MHAHVNAHARPPPFTHLPTHTHTPPPPTHLHPPAPTRTHPHPLTRTHPPLLAAPQLHPSCARVAADEEGLLPEWLVYHELIATGRVFLSKVGGWGVGWGGGHLGTSSSTVTGEQLWQRPFF